MRTRSTPRLIATRVEAGDDPDQAASHPRSTPRLIATLSAILLGLILPGSVRAALTPDYAALVAQVAAGSEAERRTFARVALEQMAASYEAELARGRGADGRWRGFMQQEAALLRARAARIDESLRIALARDGPDGVRLIIDGENVIVASPRLDAPERLESAIVAEACIYLRCRGGAAVEGWAADDRATTAAEGGQGDTGPGAPGREPFGPADEPAARTWPRLAVSDAGLESGRWFQLEGGAATYRTANGLNFQFRSIGSGQASLAALCDRIGADFEQLAAALAHARAQRWPLVWEFLRLGPALEGEQAVVINPLGDAFLLPLAEPAILDRLLPSAQAWLQQRASGEHSQHYFPQADRFLHLAGRASAAAAAAPTTPAPTTAAPTTAAPTTAAPTTAAPTAAAPTAPAPTAREDGAIDATVTPLPPGWRPL